MSQVILAVIDFDSCHGYDRYVRNYTTLSTNLKKYGIDVVFPEMEPNEDTEEKKGFYYIKNMEVVISSEQFFGMTFDANGAYTIRAKSRYQGTDVQHDIQRLTDMVDRMVDKIERLNVQIPEAQPTNTYNERCEVHVPGIGLLAINRTMLLEDSCTDVLDTALANGWQIIAACPQPNQRRPDYILGKYDPEWEPAETSAVRNPKS